MTLLTDVLSHLDMYRNFIINHDIPEAMLSKSNYLAALGLSTYTEVFGGLYRGDLSQYNGRKNYTAFIKDFFHEEYMNVNSRLKDDKLQGLYGAVRSGLVHSYLMKETSIVVMYRKHPMNCGIIYDPKGIHKITFVVEQYFQDFVKAFHKYRARIKNEPDLVDKFENALKSIGSPMSKSHSPW